jgi:inorganic pyrophosphatase
MTNEIFKPFDELDAFGEDGGVNVIIDTPRNSRNKYTYESHAGLFKLSGMLTAGHSFPYDFGFIPKTLGGDGDPLDVLVMMEEPGFVGLWVECRLIGGFEAYQTEKNGERQRNDRLLAVAESSLIYKDLQSIADLGGTVADQIVHFFVSYNEAKGKKFEAVDQYSADEAIKVVKSSLVTN